MPIFLEHPWATSRTLLENTDQNIININRVPYFWIASREQFALGLPGASWHFRDLQEYAHLPNRSGERRTLVDFQSLLIAFVFAVPSFSTIPEVSSDGN